jgi:hypothetical protein
MIEPILLLSGMLLPFGPEPSVFSSAVKKLKNENIQDDNIACGFGWV